MEYYIGIRADLVTIEHSGENNQVYNAIIGIYNKQISKEYSALIGLDLLEGGNSNENNRNIERGLQKNKLLK